MTLTQSQQREINLFNNQSYIFSRQVTPLSHHLLEILLQWTFRDWSRQVRTHRSRHQGRHEETYLKTSEDVAVSRQLRRIYWGQAFTRRQTQLHGWVGKVYCRQNLDRHLLQARPLRWQPSQKPTLQQQLLQLTLELAMLELRVQHLQSRRIQQLQQLQEQPK